MSFLRRYWKRAAMLVVTLISLYLLFPSIVTVFSSWRSLEHLNWIWALLVLVAEALSFVSTWNLQRNALERGGWLAVPTSQLASNAVGRIVPGGGATAAAVQLSMLRLAGIPPGRASSALAASSALEFAALCALPVLAIPPIAAGAPVDRSLLIAAGLGGVVLVLLLSAGGVAFATDEPLRKVAAWAQWLLNHTVRRKHPVADLSTKVIAERDFIRSVLGRRWAAAVLSASAYAVFDYLALLCAVRAVGSHPRPSLVLLAYVSGALLALIPFTPGGLGFVEAGLVGTLALAGVAGGAAVTATLLYRLVAFWLPIPLGGIAYLVFRHHYGVPKTVAVTE
jgi:uncharacterized protein (TIRG00374 family)